MGLASDPFSEKPVIVLLTLTVAFVLYRYACAPKVLQSRLTGGEEVTQPRSVHLSRLLGGVLLGVAPALVALLAFPRGLRDLGLTPRGQWGAAAPFFAVMLVVLPLVAFSASRHSSGEHYPTIRSARWDLRLHVANAASWLVFLVAYEFAFRGFLLFSLAEWTNAWTAVAITTGLYVLAHLHKPASETIGCIPMGVIFALAALRTGMMWVPLLMHFAIAVTSDVFASRGASAS